MCYAHVEVYRDCNTSDSVEAIARVTISSSVAARFFKAGDGCVSSGQTRFRFCYQAPLEDRRERNMKPNLLAEHCEQCGSSNVSLVERPMSLWDVLVMVPRSLGFLSPSFFSLSVRGNPRQRRQDQQYRCLRCNRTWHVIRERTAI